MRRSTFLVGAVLVVVIWTMSVGPAAADEAAPTRLDMQAETSRVNGEPVPIQVRLLDANGRPVGGALIQLIGLVDFLGGPREAIQDEARTGSSGEATLVFAPVERGAAPVWARFDGAPGYGPAEATLTFDVAVPVIALRSEPLGLQAWWARSRLILLPFAGIWLAYAVALNQMRKIRQYGPRASRT